MSSTVRKNRVNAIVMRARGASIDGWMEGPSSRNTVGPWWSVFHHSTEKWMIGRSMSPTTARTPLARAALRGSGIALRRAMTPR